LAGKTTKNAIKDLTAAIAELRAAFAGDSKTTQEDLAKLTDTASDLKKEFEDLQKAGEDVEETTKAQTAAQEAQLKVLEATLKILKEKNDATQQEKDDVAELIDKQKKLLRSTKKLSAEQQKNAAAGEALADSMANILGVSNNLNNSLLSQAKAALTSSEGLKSFGNNIQKNFTPANLATSILSKGIETTIFYAGRLFTEMDQGIASFNAISGAAGKFDAALASSASTMVEFGVNLDQIGGALNTLRQAFPDRELGDQSVEIARSFALWQKSGVSIDIATKSYTDLRRAFNMSSEDALGFQKNIMALGDQIGVGGPKMIADFAAAAPRLAIHGNNMEKVFKRVASASSQMGLEVDDVLSLAEGFQTFEGSAKAAGQLNSILGGGFVDNIQLMNAAFEDPAQAAMMIKDAFGAAGQTIESLGPAGVKAAAAAAGFSDVNKFQKFLNGEIDATKLAEDESLTSQKNMEEAATKSMSILESIDTAIKQLFAPLLPIMQDLTAFIKEVPKDMLASIVLGAPIIGTAFLTGIAAILGAPHAIMVGQTIAAQLAPLMAGDKVKELTGLSKFMKSGTGKIIKGAGLAGAGLMLAKDVADVARGESNAENWGAIAGSVVGGTIGILGGPAGIALGASLGNLAGEALGKTFDESKKKADASMPEKKADIEARKRDAEMVDAIKKLAASNNDMRVKLEVDEYAYKKGFKLSTAEVMSGR
jgi:hypothetical protein